MIRFATWRKIVAQFILLTLLAELAPVALFAAEGPATPETAQFEPVDGADMVELTSGDLAYTLPLLEVPGPEGGWPISMSYHAGQGPNTEATWVGLGWTLNPGAINRFVSGSPDDYFGGLIESRFKAAKQKAWAVGIGISWYGIGMNMTFGSDKSMRGFNASLNPITAALAISNLGKILEGSVEGIKWSPVDAQISVGTSGVGMGLTVGRGFGKGIGASIGASFSVHSKGGPSAGIGAGLSVANEKNGSSLSLIGVGFSSSGGGAQFSVVGMGSGGTSNSTGGHFETNTTSFGIPLHFIHPALPDLSYSYTEWEWWMDELHHERSFGAIHQDGFIVPNLDAIWGNGSDNLLANGIPAGGLMKGKPVTGGITRKTEYYISKKVERQEFDDVILSGEDVYQVNVQGLSGSFKPYFDYGFRLFDAGDDPEESGQYQRGSSANVKKHIQFRFLGDQGSNFVSLDASGGYTPIWIQDGRQMGSRRIQPYIELETGQIIGFKITAEDGKVYYFTQPVRSYYQYDETRKRDVTQKNWIKLMSPYATSWLLTAITGPDYMDQGVAGFSSDDWGYWVNFEYEKIPQLVPWRTPFTGFGQTSHDTTKLQFGEGIKEKYYLKSIETPTHVAFFDISGRYDDRPAKVDTVELASHFRKSLSETSHQFFFPVQATHFQNAFFSGANAKLRLFYNASYTVTHVSGPSNPPPPLPQWGHEDITVPSLSSSFTDDENFVSYTQTTFDTVVNYSVSNNGTLFDVTEKRSIQATVLLVDMKLSTPVSGFSRQLDSLVLYKKTLSPSKQMDIIATRNTISLESILFDYNYELCKQSPNSAAPSNLGEKGKLTLQSVEKRGKGRFSYMPPTSFTYGYNPDYYIHSWDHWNGYSSAGSVKQHFNSQVKSLADRDAGAWNLSSIQTPLGAKINIEYESDQIHRIGKSGVHGAQLQYTIWNFETSYYATSNTTKDEVTIVGADAVYFDTMITQGVRDFLILEVDIRGFYNQVDGIPQLQSIDTVYSPYSTQLTGVELTGTFPTYQLASPFTHKRDIPYSSFAPYTQQSFTTHRYLYYLYARDLYGGGHRVKSISVTDGAETRKTMYAYGEGVTACVPTAYVQSRIVNSSGRESVADAFNAMSTPPGVIYKEVHVYEAIPGDENKPIGETVYYFYTAADYGLDITESNNVIEIRDRSGIHGKTKKIETFARMQDGTLKTVKHDAFLYAFSTELSSGSIKSPAYSSVGSGSPLGLTQQRYESQKDGKPLKTINHVRENLFLIGTRSYVFNYDLNGSGAGVLTSASDNLEFDAYTGLVLTSQVPRSDSTLYVSTSHPAYWYYDFLRDRNMLSQKAYTKEYVLPVWSDYRGMSENSRKPYVMAASASTWKLWNGVARPNDNYVSTKKGNAFVEFVNAYSPSPWTAFDTESGAGDFLNGWKRTSNITEYDRYGHPIEERSLDGTYTSSLYGYQFGESLPYGEGLPVAIATNAQVRQIVYRSFEDRISGDAYTGSGSASYSGSVIDGQTLKAPNVALPFNQQYRVSGWIKQSGASEFVYHEFLTDADQVISFPGSGTIDDIRICPQSSNMTSFVYDQVTSKLLAITDANGLTTRYEYDDAGRLVIVRDHKRHIVKRHEYHYQELFR